MAIAFNPTTSTTGLLLSLDAGNTKSYPGTGTAWYDTSGNNNHFIVNASAFNSTGPKYMDFNGSFGCAITASGANVVIPTQTITAVVWTRILNNNSAWRTLFRAEGNGNDHQVIIQQGGWNIGMYDNTNATGFNNSGFSQQSLPGYGTSQWNMLIWRWYSVGTPSYSFSYNNTPGTIRGSITSTNARFKSGFRTLGAYLASGPNQFWGDISKINLYTRYLTDDELLKMFYADRGRFGI